MTQAEFSKTRWGKGMRALYRGEIYLIVQVDFEEELVGLLGEGDSLLIENLEANASELTTWARRENVELVNYQIPHL